MGAEILGYSLEAPTDPSHFELLNLDIKTVIGDVRNKELIESTICEFEPEIIFHLAAQPLVRLSYSIPVETLEVNIIGTANVFEAARNTNSVKAIVNITSDKCYENKEWVWGYRENDPVGGYDPYSVSKGCSELVTSAYRNSFFNISKYKKDHNLLLASSRAGNVIGGGDWALDRLVPDIMRAASVGEKVVIRSPYATRPWQHVLEPLSGYLMLGQKLLEEKESFAEAWNFGPDQEGTITVKSVVEYSGKYWDKINYTLLNLDDIPHEAGLLKLDCSKANHKLNWKSVWNAEDTFRKTVEWYKNYYENGVISTESDLNEFLNTAVSKNIAWTK